MAAYVTPRLRLAVQEPAPIRSNRANMSEPAVGESMLDALLDELAMRVVQRLATVAERSPATTPQVEDEWLDSRHAAHYLGIHRDTLRKLSAERAIPSEQDGPNCKLYFRRADLDSWRLAGGRPRHLAATLASAA